MLTKELQVSSGENILLSAGCATLGSEFTLKWHVMPTKSENVANITNPKFVSPPTTQLVQVRIPLVAHSEYTFRASVLDSWRCAVVGAPEP